MTKKYAAVHQPLIERLQAESEKAHKKAPDVLKAVKTKLHQLYGAYTQDNAHKKAAAIIHAMEESQHHTPSLRGEAEAIQDRQETTAPIDVTALLSLHASTKERLPHYTAFYEFILSCTGPLESIIDIGCGYNPFSIPHMQAVYTTHFKGNSIQDTSIHDNSTQALNLKAYHAYDIDTRVAELLNRFFTCLNLPPLAKCEDLAVHTPPHQADIALMCKLLPVLEAQAAGSGYKLIRGLNTRYLLITYPLKSLGGREKGMSQHYAATFEKAMAEGEFGKYSLCRQAIVGAEMIYLLTATC